MNNIISAIHHNESILKHEERNDTTHAEPITAFQPF